jgi:hypothetical protein
VRLRLSRWLRLRIHPVPDALTVAGAWARPSCAGRQGGCLARARSRCRSSCLDTFSPSHLILSSLSFTRRGRLPALLSFLTSTIFLYYLLFVTPFFRNLGLGHCSVPPSRLSTALLIRGYTQDLHGFCVTVLLGTVTRSVLPPSQMTQPSRVRSRLNGTLKESLRSHYPEMGRGGVPVVTEKRRISPPEPGRGQSGQRRPPPVPIRQQQWRWRS